MSTFNLGSPELLLPPAPASVARDEPMPGVPEKSVPGVRRGADVPDQSDPGWDKLLQDLIWGPRPKQTGPSAPGSVSVTSGNTFVEQSPSENLADNSRDRGGLRAADPFRSTGSQAPPVIAEEARRTPGDSIQPRTSSTSSSNPSKVDDAGSRASPARIPDADATPSDPSALAPPRPQPNTVVAQPEQVGAAETPSARAAFLPSPGDMPDGSLLQRYVVHREEMAFATLVQRHERLVFGVCRRVLGDSHAALDAFQATFLVLARKAGMLDKNSPLAGWLYKVAYHLALRLRGVAARRRRHEKKAAYGRSEETTSESSADLEMQELREALRDELHRLPEEYRTPLILCYFGGQTHEEAARAIGLPRGSMAKRLGEGLERLRERLTDRGFML
jgi:RNA polymerase sigma factor (sigma-70 family)